MALVLMTMGQHITESSLEYQKKSTITSKVTMAVLFVVEKYEQIHLKMLLMFRLQCFTSYEIT